MHIVTTCICERFGQPSGNGKLLSAEDIESLLYVSDTDTFVETNSQAGGAWSLGESPTCVTPKPVPCTLYMKKAPFLELPS